jgi:imidazolonepropionase-like amidohydrolase
MIRTARTLGVALAAALVLAGAAHAQDRTILVGTVLKPDGTLAPNSAVVLVAGKVNAVLPADQVKPDAKDTVRRYDAYPGAVISPGLIDLRSAAGALGQTAEHLHPVDPALSASEAIDAASPFFRDALEAGITAVMVTPAENNIVGGAAATVRTWSPAGGASTLRTDGPMTFNLGTSVLDVNQGPTSRSGALAMLRDALAVAKKDTSPDNRLARVLKKETDALVACEGAEDVDAAARTFGEYALTPNLVLDTSALEAVDDLAGSSLTVVLGPLTFSSSLKELSAPARLQKANLDVAFAGRTPLVAPVGLRVTAALAVRYGLDPARARRAMTSASAKVAGVADRVGSLEPGKDADIAIFSADPLRLDARVLEVYVQGTRAYERPTPAQDTTWQKP